MTFVSISIYVSPLSSFPVRCIKAGPTISALTDDETAAAGQTRRNGRTKGQASSEWEKSHYPLTVAFCADAVWCGRRLEVWPVRVSEENCIKRITKDWNGSWNNQYLSADGQQEQYGRKKEGRKEEAVGKEERQIGTSEEREDTM